MVIVLNLFLLFFIISLCCYQVSREILVGGNAKATMWTGFVSLLIACVLLGVFVFSWCTEFIQPLVRKIMGS